MTDCIIIGGGLIGMLTARELQQAGLDVLVLERGKLGGEATWAGGGILSPLYPWLYDDAVNALARYSQNSYPKIAQQLLDESGVDVEYTKSGLLFLDGDAEQAEKWAGDWQMKLKVLSSANALKECEPEIGNQYKHGLWMPDIAQMRNPRLVKALKGSLESKKIPYKENCEVTQLKIQHGKISGVVTNGKTYLAEKVIVAGGAWSHNIIQQFAKAPKIEPVKGQMILLKGRVGLLKRIVLSHGRYIIPRCDGRILVGSTLEHTDFKKELTQNARDDLYAAAIKLLPALKDCPIEHHWCGLRPASQQGIPYICRHPEIENLFINSGHYRNGVVLGAASAAFMADIILERVTTNIADQYSFYAKRD